MADLGHQPAGDDALVVVRRDRRETVTDCGQPVIQYLLDGNGRRSEETGIGRATLYKYFPDVEAILSAWHGCQIAGHLAQLAAVQDRPGDPGQRLQAVLEAYALISYESHGHRDTELAALLHRGGQVVRAEQELRHLLLHLVATPPRQATCATCRAGRTCDLLPLRPDSSQHVAVQGRRPPARRYHACRAAHRGLTPPGAGPTPGIKARGRPGLLSGPNPGHDTLETGLAAKALTQASDQIQSCPAWWRPWVRSSWRDLRRCSRTPSARP